METFAKVVLVGSGGFLGANLRYWLGGWMQNRLGSTFPWQTMFVNVAGSLLIGLFLGLMASLNWGANWRLFVVIGLLGGFTTYSTFAYEGLRLVADRDYWNALFYIEGTALLTVFAAWLGTVLSRLVLGGRACRLREKPRL